MKLQILPLAITMMAGPQIMSSIVFITAETPIRTSVAYISAVAIAATVGVSVAKLIASILGNNLDLNSSSGPSTAAKVIQAALVGLLILFALKNWRNRETIEPPKWLGALQRADTKKAFTAGLLLIGLMPTDIAAMLTVGTYLEANGLNVVDAIPFLALTVLIAALPLIGFLLFHRRAEVAMPKVRDWMNSHSWLVNILVAGLFIYLILF